MNDIPAKDKLLLRPYKDKQDFIQSFPQMIHNRMDDYDIYFITFTFKSELSYSYYEEYFRYFRQKLDNALLPNSKHHIKKPIFVLVPETNPKLHFHGILFIHKKTSIKFETKCILKIEEEHNITLNKKVLSFRLKDKIINPYPRKVKLKETQSQIIKTKSLKARTQRQKSLIYKTSPILKIADYKVHPLHTTCDYNYAFHYSVKNFISSEFSFSDVIIEMKDKDTPASHS